jgi:hypothetical protein
MEQVEERRLRTGAAVQRAEVLLEEAWSLHSLAQRLGEGQRPRVWD